MNLVTVCAKCLCTLCGSYANEIDYMLFCPKCGDVEGQTLDIPEDEVKE